MSNSSPEEILSYLEELILDSSNNPESVKQIGLEYVNQIRQGIYESVRSFVPDEYLEHFFVYGLNQMNSPTGRRIFNITKTFMERYEGFTNPSKSELEEMVLSMNSAFDLNKVLNALKMFDVLDKY